MPGFSVALMVALPCGIPFEEAIRQTVNMANRLNVPLSIRWHEDRPSFTIHPGDETGEVVAAMRMHGGY